MTDQPVLTIQKAIDDTLRTIRLDGRLHTARNYERGMGHFCEYIEAAHSIHRTDPATVVTVDMFIELLSYLSRHFKKKTLSVYFFGAIKLQEYLITQGLLSPTPQQTQRLAKTVKYVIQSGHDDRLPKVPSDADIQKMIDAAKTSPYPEPANARNIAIILLLAFSGCRNQEACSLRVGDLDLVSRTGVVEGKGRKDRTIHFTQPVADALLSYWKVRGWYSRSDPVFARHDPGAGKKHKPLSTQSVRLIVNEIEEAAGLEGLITPHKFRHHFATALLAATGDLALVQDELGHSSADTTRIYTRLVDQQRADKYHKAFGE